MVDAHQNVNGSHDLTTPLSGTVGLPVLALAAINHVPNLKSLWPPTTTA